MKERRLYFRAAITLLMMLCSIGAWAETLTVYDGTYDVGYSPVYGSYTDTKESASEFVIPSDKLVAMEDGTISALTFYVESKTTAPWPATFQVYIKEIPTTTLTGITGPSTSTVVYTGTLDASGTEMTVTFNNSYTYNGGNLLIGTYISEGGTYRLADFYGVQQAGNTAWYRKSLSDAGTAGQFIPKTTFTYTPPSSVVPKPKNLAASNITYEKATITWLSDQSAWNIAWSTNPDFDPASVSTRAENVSEKTYTITDLIQMTDYYVAVQDAVSGRWSPKLHFKTTSQPTAVGDGWSDDFEGTTCGWELFNGDRTNLWVWGTAAYYEGTHALYISNDGGTTNAYSHSNTMVYAAKLLTFTEGTFEFSYNWLANGESSNDYLRVALIPATESLTAGTSVPSGFSATTLPTGWIALDGGSKLNLATDWQHQDATIDVAAGNYYLVFAWRNDYSAGTNPPAAIDNVSISKYPDMITDLAVSEVTTNSATVSWNGNADSYNVRYRKQFISEDFEGGSMPAGWTAEGPGAWSVGKGDNSTSTGSHSGEKNAMITHNTRGYETYLITPSMDLSGETSLTLSFWYINRAWGNDKDGFGVYYRVGTEGTWTELWSTTEAHGSWTNQEVTLTGLAANYQLGFKMTDGYGYGVGLDDIQIISADWQAVNNITTKSTTLTGLDANTTYGCQVQGANAGKTSLWSPIATFTTMQLKDIAACDITVPNQPTNNNLIFYWFENVTDDRIHETVKDGETTLTLGTDYSFGSVYYSDMTGMNEPGKIGDECLVEIKGIGNYTGTAYAPFKIVAPDAGGTWGDNGELTWAFHDGTLTISPTENVQTPVAMKKANKGDYPWFSSANYINTITIGEGVSTVADDAFNRVVESNVYGNVTTVNLPNSLTEIGEKAFAYCDGLTVDLDDVKDITLGDNAFYQIGCLTGSLANMADNTDVITLLDQAQRNNITLTGRTLYKDGDWNTLCLPFDVTDGDTNDELTFSGTPLEGATVMELKVSESNLDSDGKLTLNFINALSIKAGKPYIVKWASGDNIVNPEFTDVTISSTKPTAVDFTGGSFVGNYAPLEITDANRNSIVLLAAGNKLGYAKTDRTIANGKALGAFRAYFIIPDNNGSQNAREFELNFGDEEIITGIIEVNTNLTNNTNKAEGIFDLQGRKVATPSKGIYIVNGKKVVF